ncbi:MAG TPA: hypothetical protein VFZ66_11135, partial [Herpetosiphonaceae bacterium]
ATGGMHTGRVGALGKVLGNKNTAKTQDERKRAEVATRIEALYSKTKTEVTSILDGLDGKVNGVFERGESAARAAFEQHVDKRMKAYKDQRYSGLLGKGKWLKDKLLGMPSEVNSFFQEGRQLYLKQMQVVINSVADVVGAELTRAKARIAQGRQEIQQFVSGLPGDLREVGQQAAEDIQSRFDQLEQDVDSKQEALVQSLAQKYVAARDAVDARITEMQKANQGLVAKAKEAIVGVIQTILELKNMLMGVLGRAAGVIGAIIKDPIRFLGNLIGAVKQGLNQFVGNIGKHLQQGLMGWLFGALGDAGIRMPESLDLKGILSLVMQVMGLTYANIRARAVKLVGEPTVKLMEGTVKVFQVLASEGPAGLWHLIQDKVGDLKEQVIGQIKEFVITKIITAGVTWLISLFNPAAAFIKACKMIYDVIMFFIERGSQIMELVGAILDSIGAIASGSIGAAANRVEQTLGKALPVAISFLASLIGVGGISQRVKKIIGSVQKPINSAIDSVVKAAAKGFKKLAGRGKAPQGNGANNADHRSQAEKQADLDQAISESEKVLSEEGATAESIRKKLPAIKSKYNLVSLNLVQDSDTKYHVHGKVNPEKDTLAKEIGAEIVTIQAPQKFGGKPIECVKKGSTYIPTGKIEIYGAGKVQFREREEYEQLKAERSGKLGKEAQRAFAKDPAKQKRLKWIEEKPLHNYQRSQGNLKSLLKAGMDPDSLQDAFKIMEHLISEIEKLDVELVVGTKIDHGSKMVVPNGSMKVDSKWEVKDGTPPLLYLDTIIYIKK